MRNSILVLMTVMFSLLYSTAVFAGEEQTCVLIKFSNDTRYKKVDTANLLSDLVLEKLVASGKFNFKETIPIDEDLEKKIYDIKSRELANAEIAMNTGNLNELFEGSGFDDKQAQSVGTATLGQIITPSVTAEIGQNHNAEYLIQGNIISLGNGAWIDSGVSNSVNNINLVSGITGAGIFLPSIDQKEGGIGVQTDLRVIKASTGEVIWRKIVIGKSTSTLTSVGAFKIGSSKVTSEHYAKAVENAAQQIADAMVEDLNRHRLFVK